MIRNFLKNKIFNKTVVIKGSGSIANKHIKILNKLGLNILILIKNNKEKKRYQIKKLNKISFINNLKNINKKNILFAIIANSTDKHINFINYFIKEKINIFCEKPISNKFSNLNSIRKKIIKYKNFFYVNYQLKQHEFLKTIIKIVKKEKIYHAEFRVGQNLKYWRKNKIRKNSYYLNTKKGGGVIFELIHEINLINHILGNIKKIKTIKSKFNLKNAEDQAVSIFETEKKIPGTLVQDMLSEKKERYIKFLTKKNLIKFDFIKNKILYYQKEKIFKIKTLKNNDKINLIERNIINYLNWLQKKNFHTTFFDEAVNDLKICKKMYEKF